MDTNYLITLFNGDNPLTFVIGVFVGVITKRYGTMAYDSLLKRVNVPNSFYPLLGKRFYGLYFDKSTKKDFNDYQIKSGLYVIFSIFKQLGLTVENTSKILYRNAFKEKGDIDTIGLFAEISKRVLKSVDKHFWLNTETPSHKRFKFMLKEFEELSQPYLCSQEAYLLMMLSVSCLGAVYFQHLYPYCIMIVMKMTIENSNLAKLDPSNKYYFFLLFSSFFIQDILKSEDLVNEGIIYYKTKKDEKDFDIFSFVKNAINSQLPNGAKQ